MGRRRKLDPLTPKQREILEVVWELGEASVFEVRLELSKRRKVARNTIRTMMERLEEKGWLAHRVIGRTYFYTALVDRRENLGQRIIDVVESVCGGSPEHLMSALLEHRGLSSKEIDRIQGVLDAARRKPKRKSRRL